jgi:hypothetical protein
MYGPIVERMAEAIENSEFAFICMSNAIYITFKFNYYLIIMNEKLTCEMKLIDSLKVVFNNFRKI